MQRLTRVFTPHLYIFYKICALDKPKKKLYNIDMEKGLFIKPVAYIRNDYKEKFGIPRQSGRAPSVLSEIVFEKEYQNPDALREIEGFSHLWLLFDFSLSHRGEWSATVRPPRLGGNARVGVFASRSPFRPNPIGLSCVRLLRVEKRDKDGLVLMVSGADLLDGTPIFDVKPYLPFADCIDDATGGYASAHENHGLQVDFPQGLLCKIDEDKRQGLLEILADDPRPSYQDDERIYGMRFGDYEIKFSVNGGILHILSVEHAVTA